MSTSPRTLLIALNACPTLSRDAVCRLASQLEIFGREERSRSRSARVAGVTSSQLARAFEAAAASKQAAEQEHRRAAEHGFRILTILDADYPPPLRDLELPPPVLYVEGEIPGAPAYSIVGSRKADAYGLEAAELFGRHLAAAGLTIVSGLARGIDGRAHRSAVSTAGGRSIAVLACGLDITYPLQHTNLRRRLVRTGAVISEFPLGAAPRKQYFPIRNRLIAALGCACLVVQSTQRSGSLITARLALELGRDVHAVPGRIFDRGARGTNALIRDGALAALHPREVLDVLPWAVKETLAQAEPQTDEAEPADRLPSNEVAARVLRVFESGRTYAAEELTRATDLPLPRIQALLLELEMDGWLARHPGPVYSRRHSRHL